MAQAAQDLSTREVRAKLADVINDAAAHGTVTFITSHGRRIAAVVPVAVGVAAIEQSDS
ncbi:type II toxin-antitoxin system prevent-host-death family antitoxin (plasmid) [Nonomuraea sp. CA-143628]|uniref:type II toxin-antitoxin system prevent-host-death family antitoxin n=1 Tax=Nonomuraea sp. CA-143628 TaxID=3239997 RepID=UPI003D92F3DA